MGLPIATTEGGICFAFPDACKTPAGPGPPPPVPYPNIGKLKETIDVSTTVRAKGNYVILKDSSIPTTSGDQSGTAGNLKGTGPGGPVTFDSASESVRINGGFVVRMTDNTLQNDGNARGNVLGGVPNVRCG